MRHWPVQGSNSRHWPARKAVNYTVGQCRGSAGLAPFSSPGQASAGRVACATAPPGESLRGAALGVRTGLVRRARAGHVDTWSHARCVGSTDLPGVLGVLVAAVTMSVLPPETPRR